MRHMITKELLKLWKRKSFLIMLCVIVAANIGMLFYNDSRTEAPQKAYKEFDSHLQKLSEKDREKYVEEYSDKVEGLLFVENINLMAAGNLEKGDEIAAAMKDENPQLYERYYNDWKNKNYHLYTENLFTESSFMEDVKNRMELPIKYDDYVEEIVAKKEEVLGISIFSGSENNGENTFSGKVIRQTAEKYSTMNDIKTDVYTYKWMDYFTSGGFLEALFALLTFILVHQMIYEEKSRHLFYVLRATPRGRTDCIISKIAALFLNIGGVVFLMYGAVFAYSVATVGIYGMNAPIQSVAEFIACPYRFRVWQFVVGAVLIKWLVLFVFALLLLWMGILVSHYVITFASGTCVLGVCAAEYYFISGASKWNIFHYLNLWQFLKPEQVIGNYVLLNVWKGPKSVCVLMSGLVASAIVILVAVCIVTFAQSKNLLNEKSISFQWTNLIKGKISRIGFQQKTYKSIWGYESYKILIMNLGILVIVLFGVGMAVSGKNEKCYLTPNEMHYRQWMQDLNGNLTEEKEVRIQNQKAYYDDVMRQLEGLEQALETGELSENVYDDRKMSLESKLAFYPAFQRVYERYEYVKKDGDRQFVYEDGYYKLLGKKDSWYVAYFVGLVLMLILFLTTTFTTDKEKGMHHIIRTAPKGRFFVTRDKIAIGFVGALCMYLCFLLRNIYVAQTHYGMESLLAAASNLKGLEEVWEGVSILIMIVVFSLVQIICLLAVAAVIMFTANKIGNTIYAIVWETVVLFVVAAVINVVYPFVIL